MRYGGRGGMVRTSWKEVRTWVGRSAMLLPSETHTNPPPLSQSLPPPSSLTPPSPDTDPCSPVCTLPHTANWLALTDSAPIKEKIEEK